MKEKKFEDLMTELESIIKELETGEVDLESSINKYTEAMKIVKVCGEKLDVATESVNKILNENGTLSDFNIEDKDNTQA